MADVNISKFRAQVVRDGFRPANPGFVESEGQNPVDPAGSGQNHLPVTIAPVSTGLAITDAQVLGGAGTVAQYIRGDGSLADFPATTGGGSSVSYYLNGSVSQGTIGGVAYKELNRTPIFGAGTDISISSDGYIASFITDAGDPNKLEIPAGNWNLETYFSASSGGGNPTFYVELYKYNGTTFTLIASNASSPELIAFGTNLNPYFSTLAVPQTTLALTDRLALRYYVTTSGRTITLHTENDHLCQVITTFTTGLTALNGLTTQVQFFAVGTSGTDFAISSATDTHTFNLPTASATNRGALSSADWSTFNGKENAITAGTTAQYFRGDKTFQTLNTSVVPEGTNLYYTEARVNANTNVAANTAARHNAVTLGTANGLSLSTQVLSLGLASAGVTGALSGTDWSTFNSKQNALTNPVTGTGTTNFLPKFTGSTTIGDSVISDNTNEINIPKRIFLNSGGQSIFFTPNLSSASNRIEGSSGVPLEIFTSGSALRFAAGGVSTQITLLSSGNIGIGTTSPDSATNYATLSINGSGGGQVTWQSAGSKIGYVYSTSSNLIIGADASKNLIFDAGATERARITSGGNVLIGTSTDLGVRLLVAGDIATSTRIVVDTINGYNGGSTPITIQTGGAQAIVLGTNATERMRITSGGNVLIGGTSDAAGGLLQVLSSSNTAISIRSTTTGGTQPRLRFFHDGNDEFVISGGDGLRFLGNGVNERMRITSSGNVGIGTTSPAQLFTVRGTATNLISLHYSNDAGGVGYGIYNSAGTELWSIGGGRFIQQDELAISRQGVAALYINSSRNVLIGTTTDNGARLQIEGGATEILSVGTSSQKLFFRPDSAGVMISTATAQGGEGIYFGNASDFMYFQTANTERMRITSGGNVLIGTTTDVGARLHVNGAVRTGAPSGGSAVDWRLGTARGGTITPNAIVRVEIGGVLVDLDARYV